jgi:hypothetical protein
MTSGVEDCTFVNLLNFYQKIEKAFYGCNESMAKLGPIIYVNRKSACLMMLL